ncbi:MAG: ParB/RepB/Spo0J family partition protein [Oscillospiraceae bacterium]|nr:ParB/RepB/Spo0J family partition protein [Oscillospiraceae bacterium]
MYGALRKGGTAMEKKKTLFQSNRIYQIPIDRIVPNPRQPRRHFDSQAMKELSESIRQHGMLQPISVQKTGEGFVLVAGERRLRAAAMAGLTRVPCLLVRGSDRDSALLALIENLQRCDLHYTEEAAAIARLISSYDMSQEEAARRLGRSQSAVANKLRLLKLSPECVDKLRQYHLTERHARALLRLEGNEQRIAAACYMGEKQLNVAASEEYIEGLLQKKQRENAVKRSVYVIKDVRLFLNSVDRSMENIRRAGVDARCDKQESEDTITITIQIPKRKGFRSPDAAAENR